MWPPQCDSISIPSALKRGPQGFSLYSTHRRFTKVQNTRSVSLLETLTHPHSTQCRDPEGHVINSSVLLEALSHSTVRPVHWCILPAVPEPGQPFTYELAWIGFGLNSSTSDPKLQSQAGSLGPTVSPKSRGLDGTEPSLGASWDQVILFPLSFS